jgi:hypothetical protein
MAGSVYLHFYFCSYDVSSWLRYAVQMELKIALSTIVATTHVRLDRSKMTAQTPADLVAGVRTAFSLSYEGGVHLRMQGRADD